MTFIYSVSAKKTCIIMYMYIPYSDKFWMTKKLANFIKTTKILVCQIFTPYELGRGRVENT